MASVCPAREEAVQAHAGAGSFELRDGAAQRADRGGQHRIVPEPLQSELQQSLDPCFTGHVDAAQRLDHAGQGVDHLARIAGQGGFDRGGGAFTVAQHRERPGGVRGGGDHRDPLQVDAHAVTVSHDPVDNRVTSRSTERAMAVSTHPAKGPGRPYSQHAGRALVVALGQDPPRRDVGEQYVVVAGHPGAVPAVRGTEAQRVVHHRLAGQGDHELP